MQTTTVHKNIGLLMFVFACAMMLLFSINTHAQGRGHGKSDRTITIQEDRKGGGQNKDKKISKKDDRDDRRGGGVIGNDQDERINGRDRRGNQSERFAYKQGYKAGFKDGKRAAKDNRRVDIFNDASFPTNGNRNGWARNAEWRRAYEEAYRRGYRDAYDRYRRTDRRDGTRRILGIPLPY